MKKSLIWRLQLAAAVFAAVTSAAVSAASSPPAPSASALRSTQATTQDTAAGLTKMTPTFANGERTPQVAMSAATGRDKLQTGGAHASLKHIKPISLTHGGGGGGITAASLVIPNLWETAAGRMRANIFA